MAAIVGVVSDEAGFGRIVAEQRQRLADLLPVAGRRRGCCRSTPGLAGAHLDHGLVGLQFDDQVARRRTLGRAAVPFQHPHLLDVLDRSGNGQYVDHAVVPGRLRRRRNRRRDRRRLTPVGVRQARGFEHRIRRDRRRQGADAGDARPRRPLRGRGTRSRRRRRRSVCPSSSVTSAPVRAADAAIVVDIERREACADRRPRRRRRSAASRSAAPRRRCGSCRNA